MRDIPIGTPDECAVDSIVGKFRGRLVPELLVEQASAALRAPLSGHEKRPFGPPADRRPRGEKVQPSLEPAVLTVTAPVGDRLQVRGLLSPVTELRAHYSNAVIIGNDCRVRHSEIHQLDVVAVDLGIVLNHPDVVGPLGKLVQQPDDRSADNQLCCALQQLLPDQTPDGPDRLDTPLAALKSVTVEHAHGVQVGNSNTLNSTVAIEHRRTRLSAAGLLTESRTLRDLLVVAVREGVDGPAMTSFLRGCLEQAGCMDELDMLNRVEDPTARGATLFALFGYIETTGAAIIMAGAGNSCTTDVDVNYSRVSGDDIVADVAALHALLVPDPQTLQTPTSVADLPPALALRAASARGALTASPPTVAAPPADDQRSGGNREGTRSDMVDGLGMPCRGSCCDGVPCPARDAGLCR